MANYADLKNAITAVIRTNGNQEITGQLLQDALMAIIDNIGGLSGFAGIADPDTVPGSPDSNQFYLIGTPGVYPNFGGLEVEENAIYIANNQSGSWEAVKLLEVDTSGFATREDLAPLEATFVKSKNLLDKNRFEPGNYNPGGVYSGSLNWINSGLHPIPDGISSFTLSGLGAYTSSYPMVLFYDSSGAFISSVLRTEGPFPKTFSASIIPSGATHWIFNLANSTGIGENPSDNPIANVAMLRDSGTSDSYAPYGGLLDPERLTGPIPDMAHQSDLEDTQAELEVVSDSVDALFSAFDPIYTFNGSTSQYDFGKRLLIKNEGDFFETEVKWGGSVANDGLGLAGVGEDASGQNIFGFYNSSSIWLREIGSSLPYIQFTGLGGFGDFNIIRLQVSGGNYELLMNGVVVGSAPVTSGLEIKYIGYGYNQNRFLGEIKYVKIKSGAEEIDLSVLAGPGAVDIGMRLDIPDGGGGVYPDLFYDYSPTAGTNGVGRFRVFVKRKGSANIYAGHNIERQLNMDPATYIDYWRNRGAWNYRYDGATMSPAGTQALLNVENEFTMLCPGKADHTGGTHGDEIATKVSFIADSEEISLDEIIPLTPCGDLKYQVVSTLHETAPTGGDPVPGHPVIADHVKTVTFSDGGWVCRNMVKSRLANLEISRIYTGLICNHKDQANHGFTDVDGYITIMNGDNSEKLKNPAGREFFGNNPSTGLSSYITSKCVYPSSLAEPAVFYINDRPTDSKYYRWIGPVTLDFGESVVVESEIKCIGK